ncbi:MAG: FeoA domain-containing protein [Elusimicrobia bacterium]|nr:FeoA domain-containing protein [Elusimicrobiota bacterium]
MCRLKSGALEEEEEALGVVWRHRELGKTREEQLRAVLTDGVATGVLDRLKEKGLVRLEAGSVEFTGEGARLAEDVTRRHRLAERLLVDILDMHTEGVDEDACRWEHILTPKATRAICTLLGHPRHCPHGTPIPPGPCCAQRAEQAGSVISSLGQLGPGKGGRVLYLAFEDQDAMRKLLALGISPGTNVTLKQCSPTVVVAAGETVVALEESLARHIFVRKD